MLLPSDVKQITVVLKMRCSSTKLALNGMVEKQRRYIITERGYPRLQEWYQRVIERHGHVVGRDDGIVRDDPDTIFARGTRS